MKKQDKQTKKITKNILFSELINKHPEIIEELFESGMHCIGCPMAMQETLEQGALAHGINPEELVERLNKKIDKEK